MKQIAWLHGAWTNEPSKRTMFFLRKNPSVIARKETFGPAQDGAPHLCSGGDVFGLDGGTAVIIDAAFPSTGHERFQRVQGHPTKNLCGEDSEWNRLDVEIYPTCNMYI